MWDAIFGTAVTKGPSLTGQEAIANLPVQELTKIPDGAVGAIQGKMLLQSLPAARTPGGQKVLQDYAVKRGWLKLAAPPMVK